ncbi:hypothetical protein HMPREF0724_13082 [Prescottella equi ATCC 33707]|uniref:Uncharacterized protein n=1 Tax=Prescottella equi ATCC 33707 TaxID=525370 RepID=E9T353_RHOHA|nr:hypothetical protein HMPREF0724_13082 [Prescottella equi ATCC 33707]
MVGTLAPESRNAGANAVESDIAGRCRTGDGARRRSRPRIGQESRLGRTDRPPLISLMDVPDGL